MIINLFGDGVCFSYPRDRKKSQMLFSSRIRSVDMVETLRKSDHVKLCAKTLRTECEEFDFLLQRSFNSAADILLSFQHYIQNRPSAWNVFFDAIFPFRSKSENIMRKCDTIFQIVFYLVHNGHRKTPLHVSLCETIHDTCRSKTLIQIMNRMGLSISYDELERIDIRLATRTIESAGQNRVPVSETIDSSTIIHGAMDNYDNQERTRSGIGSSHDIILMLFQNAYNNIDDHHTVISKVPETMSSHKRSLAHIMDCQKLVKYGRFSGRGEIPTDFMSKRVADNQMNCTSISNQYKTWLVTRHVVNSRIPSLSTKETSGLPSFSATKSLLMINASPVTRIAFTPIIPHPATEYDTIQTAIINFQDVLHQKGLSSGPLWSDEGVYRIAKEIQLLQPDKFSNIFLGIGGFHLESIIIVCCGKYLEVSGIGSVLVANEIYGPQAINSVMDGGHYVRGKRGMSMIAEALEHLQLSAFFKEAGTTEYKRALKNITDLQSSFDKPELDQ